MATQEEIEENKIINEEYKFWKKNSYHLYDYLLAQGLEWPSLTCQIFPDLKTVEATGSAYPYTEQRILFGTNTSGKGKDQLIIGKITHAKLLNHELKEEGKTSQMFREAWNTFHEDGEIGGYGTGHKPKAFEIVQRINHQGEVHKARYMPQNPDLIATMGIGGQVAFFDRTKHPLVSTNDDFRPDILLVGHEQEGFGLSWDMHQEGRLATASYDTTVRLWDIQKTYKKSSTGTAEVQAVDILRHHHAVANDAEFNPLRKDVLATVGDDKRLCIVDLREANKHKAALEIIASKDAINTLAWHPDMYDGNLIATGDSEGVVAIWSIKSPKEPLASSHTHSGPINKVQWHPEESSVLASCSADRQMHFYDLSRVGQEVEQEDMEDGPPELIFIHGGFTNSVSDFDFAKTGNSWQLLAVSEDNQIQSYIPARRLVMPEQMDGVDISLDDVSDEDEV